MRSISQTKYISRIWLTEYDSIHYFKVIGCRGNKYYYQSDYVMTNIDHNKYKIDREDDLPNISDDRFEDIEICREQYLEQVKKAKLFLGISK